MNEEQRLREMKAGSFVRRVKDDEEEKSTGTGRVPFGG